MVRIYKTERVKYVTLEENATSAFVVLLSYETDKIDATLYCKIAYKHGVFQHQDIARKKTMMIISVSKLRDQIFHL